MKVLIVSDTHKSIGNLDKVLGLVGKIDMLIHLGDVEGQEDYVEAAAGCEVHVLAGNNDYFSSLPQEKEFYIGSRRVFAAHGHFYWVNRGEDRLKAEARRRGADIVMYGHTHVPALTVEPDLITLNPGSISFPRQSGRKPSYIVMETDCRGNVECKICYI